MYFVYIIISLFSLYYINHNFSKNSNRVIIIIWFILLIIMGTKGYFTDDYEPYEDQVMQAYALPFSNMHMEYVWIKLADFCKGNVVQFRLISFSLLSISLLFLCKLLKIECKYFICYYTLICLSSHLCWIRQPLAMTIFLIGTAFLIKRNILVAIPFFVISFLLHKTSIVFLILLISAKIPITRKTICLYIIIGLAFIVGFNLILRLDLPFSSFLKLYLESESEFEHRNIIIILLSGLGSLCNFFIVGGLIYHFYNYNSKVVLFYIRFAFCLTCLALCLLFIPYETDAMIGRLMAMALFCSVLILSIALKSNLFQIKYYRIFLPLLSKFLVSQMMTLGNNYTRVYRLTRLF